jgi:hypothetical protein
VDEPEDVPLKAGMKAPRRKAKLDDDDKRLKAGHRFGDIGPAVEEADYKARRYGNPEQVLAEIFSRERQDYGGPYASIDAIDGGENTAPRSLR